MTAVAIIILVIVFLFLFYVAWVALHPLPDLCSRTEDEINAIIDEEITRKTLEMTNKHR